MDRVPELIRGFADARMELLEKSDDPSTQFIMTIFGSRKADMAEGMLKDQDTKFLAVMAYLQELYEELVAAKAVRKTAE